MRDLQVLGSLDLYSRTLDQDQQIAGEVGELRARVVEAQGRTEALERRRATETETLSRRTFEHRAAYAALVTERDRLSNLRAQRQATLRRSGSSGRSGRPKRTPWQQRAGRSPSLLVAAPTGSPTGGSTSSGFIWPVNGTVVSPYGMRWGRLHAGIDIAAPAGTPVVASASGRVIYSGWMSGYGMLVVVQHSGGIATAYAHNSSVAVSIGQSVNQGQRVASVGCTGHCYGNHVHFEVRVNGRPVDPMGYQ